jgi:hypothetical protein
MSSSSSSSSSNSGSIDDIIKNIGKDKVEHFSQALTSKLLERAGALGLVQKAMEEHGIGQALKNGLTKYDEVATGMLKEQRDTVKELKGISKILQDALKNQPKFEDFHDERFYNNFLQSLLKKPRKDVHRLSYKRSVVPLFMDEDCLLAFFKLSKKYEPSRVIDNKVIPAELSDEEFKKYLLKVGEIVSKDKTIEKLRDLIKDYQLQKALYIPVFKLDDSVETKKDIPRGIFQKEKKKYMTLFSNEHKVDLMKYAMYKSMALSQVQRDITQAPEKLQENVKTNISRLVATRKGFEDDVRTAYANDVQRDPNVLALLVAGKEKSVLETETEIEKIEFVDLVSEGEEEEENQQEEKQEKEVEETTQEEKQKEQQEGNQEQEVVEASQEEKQKEQQEGNQEEKEVVEASQEEKQEEQQEKEEENESVNEDQSNKSSEKGIDTNKMKKNEEDGDDEGEEESEEDDIEGEEESDEDDDEEGEDDDHEGEEDDLEGDDEKTPKKLQSKKRVLNRTEKGSKKKPRTEVNSLDDVIGDDMVGASVNDILRTPSKSNNIIGRRGLRNTPQRQNSKQITSQEKSTGRSTRNSTNQVSNQTTQNKRNVVTRTTNAMRNKRRKV